MLSRTELLVGAEAIARLKSAKIIVFGVGGVGGYVCESLIRAGLGEIHIVDGDIISKSNLNRQIIATKETIGKSKVEVMKERILSINPQCKVYSHEEFILPDNFGSVPDFTGFDYVVDAIDTVAGKIAIIEKAKLANVPIISSMGTGNKLNPLVFEITDISKTSVCPLARVMRKLLRERGISKVNVLYSREEPIKTGTKVPGSISFVPPAAGLAIGSFVIKEIMGIK